MRDAAVVATTAAAVAAGTSCGLFWAAFHDPVAIGWVFTPFIGAFWGCTVGLLTGGCCGSPCGQGWSSAACRRAD